MSGEHKRFAYEEDEELRRIRQEKSNKLIRLKEEKPKMSGMRAHGRSRT
jgi:hypothetical protein